MLEPCITAKELIETYNLKPFQLCECLREGLLQPIHVTDKKIIDPRTEHGKKIIEAFEKAAPRSYEQWEKSMRRKSRNRYPQWPERKIKERARLHYEGGLIKTNGCIRKSFSVPDDAKEAVRWIREAKGWLFKADDVLEFVEKQGLVPAEKIEDADKDSMTPGPSSLEVALQVDDHEAFVRNLRISPESDSQIRIQELRKSPESCDRDTLGFKNAKSEWGTLLKILGIGTYCVGASHINGIRSKNYDAKQKRLKAISKKMIIHFNKHYSKKIPEGYNLFELCLDKEPGTYKPIFQMIDTSVVRGGIESKYNHLQKTHLLDKIHELVKKFQKISTHPTNNKERTNRNKVSEELSAAVKSALKKNWTTKEQVTNMFKPNTDKAVIWKAFQDIRYDPHENQEDIEPTY